VPKHDKVICAKVLANSIEAETVVLTLEPTDRVLFMGKESTNQTSTRFFVVAMSEPRVESVITETQTESDDGSGRCC
jgi:hypothetical protein